MADDALYIVNLNYNSGVVGGGSMKMTVAVDPVRGSISGGAEGTILEGTQHAPTFKGSGDGHLYNTGFGENTKLGTISGRAVVSFPPPAIGSYEAPFTASFAVDNAWNGKGKFSVGPHTYECQVEKVG